MAYDSLGNMLKLPTKDISIQVGCQVPSKGTIRDDGSSKVLTSPCIGRIITLV